MTISSVRFLKATAVAVVFVLSAFPSAMAQGDDPAPSPGFTGVSLKVQSATIPPGGTYQYQLMLTEPKPIGNGSARPTMPSGSVSGISLNDPIGQTAGVAVVNDSGILINVSSPRGTFGTSPDLDYPIITIAETIPPDALVGSRFPASIDLPSSLFWDPFGQPYPTEAAPGTLTIGGNTAISNIIPGSGFQRAGTTISILGMGFDATSTVNMAGLNLTAANYRLVSPSQIDVVLPQGILMDGERIRVKTSGTVVTYFSYLRAQKIGVSGHALVNQCYPLFARARFSSASLNWSRGGTTFTGLAIQNPGSLTAEITLQMISASGQVLDTASFPVAPLSKITRDLTDFFAQPSPQAVAVRVTSDQAVQMLGLLGDDATGIVAPVFVSAP